MTTATPLPVPPSRSVWADIRDALRGRSHDHTQGSLNRSLLLLAIPMTLEMVLESVFSVVDLFCVSALGSGAVATVGVTESMLTIVYAIAIGLSAGAMAMVARRVGERDVGGARVAAAQAIWLGLGVGLVLGWIGGLFPVELLGLMGLSAETIAAGAGYTRVVLGGNVLVLLLFLHNAVFRGTGDAALAMRSLWLGNAINIVLDPCLVFGLGPFPELGLFGAAIATVIGRGVGVLYQLRALTLGAGVVRLGRDALRPVPAVMRRLAVVSLGGIGQFLIGTASWLFMVTLIAPFGADALAGYTAAIRVLMFAVLPAWGLSNAAATLVGQNLGARQPERAAAAAWLTGTWNMLFLAGVAVFTSFFPEILLAPFSIDPGAREIAEQAVRVIGYGYPFYAWGMVAVQSLNGAGDTGTPTKLNIVCYWLVQIPLAWGLAHGLGHGPIGVFWAVTGAEALAAVAGVLAFRRGAWKTRVV